MKKIHVVLIIVSVLIILSIIGFFVYKNLNTEIDDWNESSGDEIIEEMLFKDVSKNHWASEYISYLTQRKIMFASGDGNFYPDNKVTFGEFVEILLRASMGNLNFENLSGDDFIDVLVKNNIFKENEITKEKFNENITKSEVAIILAKVDIKLRNNEQIINTLSCKDLKSTDEVSLTLIGHSVKRGFLKLNTENNFYPNAIFTRAQIAEIIYLFLNK